MPEAPPRKPTVRIDPSFDEAGELSQEEAQSSLTQRISLRYEVLGLIARGSFSIVYRARDRVDGREVAIKILQAEYSHAAIARERMARELDALGRLDHPHIIRPLDVDAADDQQTMLVLELLRGPTLGEVLKRAPMPAAQVAAIGAQIASGLAAAHGAGLVHRDLKPTNVLFTDENELHLKILDFGLVRSSDGEATRITVATQRLGTPGYVAPEQITDPTTASFPADIYALGVILYSALAGRAPYSYRTVEQALEQHLRGVAEPLPVHRGVGPIVMRMLAKDPAARPAAAEVMVALDGIARGRGGEPRRAQVITAPFVGSVLLLLAVAALVFTAVMAGEPDRAPVEPAPEVSVPQVLALAPPPQPSTTSSVSAPSVAEGAVEPARKKRRVPAARVEAPNERAIDGKRYELLRAIDNHLAARSLRRADLAWIAGKRTVTTVLETRDEGELERVGASVIEKIQTLRVEASLRAALDRILAQLRTTTAIEPDRLKTLEREYFELRAKISGSAAYDDSTMLETMRRAHQLEQSLR